MNEISRLFELQTADLELDEKRRQMLQLESKIGETATLQAARQQLADAVSRGKSLTLTVRRLEGELEACSAKIADLQKRLFGGAVGKQKEAGAVEHQLQSLRETRGKIEDELLEVMSEAEEAPSRVAELTALAERQGDLWRIEQTGLLAERDSVRLAITALEETRRRLAAVVPENWLRTYDDLRRRHRGRAVAKVERSTCQGCRVALPMGEVQHARKTNDLAFCSFCGRIIYVER